MSIKNTDLQPSHRAIQQLELFSVAAFDATTDYESINQEFNNRSLEDLLTWSLAIFGDKLVQVTSFGPTGMVILEHLARLSPGIRIVTIDTGFLFDETYALWETVQRRYPIQLDVRRAALSPAIQARIHPSALWQVNPDLCCHIRKVEPITEVLHQAEAWLTGLRRDQSRTRAKLPLIAWDQKYGLVKLNPLAHWTRGQVWGYILEHNIPYNSLHDQGFASIGCTHCTRATTQATDERSGRWQGREKTECGLHI
ncbi:MAG: phosphoadenylyl-sulfate reductase [Anaerolineae bacterium]|nr:phosphoadenylyl-sulfate reductase [Anaerolineae bacterium]